ncbi:MAG: DarT ssDNA thymidine ADP-ribosyltransferase family protein [Thermodesulfobacteriota bacterium]|nr:DarT ssDNA thymidine ADP-ribosyltransferase family protein [Thermodesulfobacteriota bacterium]
MERHELTELHYITPIANVPSILEKGILSHNRAKRVEHQSVVMNEIQDRRAKVTIPGGRRLREYVNLYICARNPMMYKRQAQFKELCVLKISPDVIDLPRVVVSDRNASSEYAIFKAAPGGLGIVNNPHDPVGVTTKHENIVNCGFDPEYKKFGSVENNRPNI